MTPIEIVERFCRLWDQPGGFYRSFEQYLTDDCVYENVGMSKTVGAAQSIAMFKEMEKAVPFTHISVEMLGIAAQGNVVMTERVDDIKAGDGSVLVSLRVMGVFVVEGDKITQWRDYFDVTPFRQ